MRLLEIRFLVTLFGDCLIDVGIDLCVRSGSNVDGVEILALLTFHEIGRNVLEVIFTMNTFLFLATTLYFGITTALYSVAIYFSAVKSFDYISTKLAHDISLDIISSKRKLINCSIVGKFGKRKTVIKVGHGYLPENFDLKSDCDIIVTVLTRLKLFRIKDKITKPDSHAFMYIKYIKEVSGRILKHNKID